ncbi:MAG TPA: hemolysin family protein [Myxococcaceae bacterium]|nr:hemolysin family protein [Myxococcaceae bacterium]
MSREAWHIAVAVGLVLINAFFVASEMALVRARPTRFRTLAAGGNRAAERTLAILGNLGPYLGTVQFGMTLTSLGMGWVGEPAFAALVERALHAAFPGRSGFVALAHTLAFVVGFAIITILHLVIGELVPKNLGLQRTESVAMAVSGPMRAIYLVSYPAVTVINRMAAAVSRLLGLKPAASHDSVLDTEELAMLVDSSARAGSITEERAELLARALAVSEKTARQVLVPRQQVRYLDLEEPLERNIAEARAAGHTWLPVARGTLDQVEGVVNVKDLFFLLANGQLHSIGQVQRPVLFVPENVTLEQLLIEFRKRRRQLAVVVDEHGGTSGIVTLADVVAEVVGDVAELGRRVSEVKTLPGGRLELPGTTQLSDLEDRLDVRFDVDPGEVSTIAGFLMARLGRVPEPGDHTEVDEFEIRVAETDGPRVVKVLIEPKPQAEPSPPAASA